MSPGPDVAFAHVSKQFKNHTVIADPRQLAQIINNECKNMSAQWLNREKHIDFGSYLRQYYFTDNFLRVDGEPLLMKARMFEFGFSQIFDKDTNTSIVVQSNVNEIKIKLSFDNDANLYSYTVQQQPDEVKRRNCSHFLYTEPLKLERNRIKDLLFQRRYLPQTYNTDEIEIYNLDPEHDACENDDSSDSD